MRMVARIKQKNKDKELRPNNILGGGCRLLAVVLAQGTTSLGSANFPIKLLYKRILQLGAVGYLPRSGLVGTTAPSATP
jgi:hypothetical protein